MVTENFGIHGTLTFSTLNDDGSVCDSATSDNIICYTGLNVMLPALLWDFIEDQNTTMGSPFSVAYCAPIMGAVGTGVATPADSDVALVTEVARAQVMAAGITNGSAGIDGYLSFSFLFGLPGSNYSIIEAGVFLQGAAAVPGSGSLFDHATLAAVSWSTTQLATLVAQFSFGNS
jgi:hypothetical protein